MWVKVAGRYVNLDNVQTISINTTQIFIYFRHRSGADEFITLAQSPDGLPAEVFNKAKKTLEEKLSTLI